MKVIAPEEVIALFDLHEKQDLLTGCCDCCGEEAPCATLRLIAELTEERARRIWAERQLRAQRTGAASIGPVPSWERLSLDERLYWNALAVKQVLREEDSSSKVTPLFATHAGGRGKWPPF